MNPVRYDIHQWLEENEKFFVPPICNKLMYKDGQLKTFFVGGPNSRKDFHMEEGEELFYMLKGDMNLIVFEQGKFRDIVIKEGEIFLLPGRIPHSPQRKADTIGLVIERERDPTELDCLRYYVDGSDEILYEKWFHCVSLEELGPLIKEYFQSEAHKTGRPTPGSILEDKPLLQDFKRKLSDPFPLQKWLQRHQEELNRLGKVALFEEEKFASRIHVLGNGVHASEDDTPETFLWQITGTSSVEISNNAQKLTENQTLLIPSGKQFILKSEDSSRTLSVIMNPRK